MNQSGVGWREGGAGGEGGKGKPLNQKLTTSAFPAERSKMEEKGERTEQIGVLPLLFLLPRCQDG